MIAGSSIFIFRWRDPQAAGPCACSDIRWFPRCSLLSAAVLLYCTFSRNLAEFLLRLAGYSGWGAGFGGRVGGERLPRV